MNRILVLDIETDGNVPRRVATYRWHGIPTTPPAPEKGWRYCFRWFKNFCCCAMFRDRDEAARALAVRLKSYQGKKPLIIAIPRGAVPMGRIVADALGGELDVALVRKLRAPQQPEFAIGSVDESGWTYIADYAAAYGADQDYIAAEKRTQLQLIRKRRAQYTPVRPPVDPHGRIVVVVDDGLATGATMIAALRGLRTRGPALLICAVPVAPPDTLKKISGLADQVICLEVPEYFQAVGQFYAHFPQIEDDEVIALLRATEK